MKHTKHIFFTSDWHIGHANVIKFSNRPFRNTNHMAKVLINNYNATVPYNGVCYFLGDMGLCSSSELSDVINQLNGTKVLILGNHDQKTQAMYKRGFDVVVFGATIMIAGERVTMSHCPLRGLYREDTEGMRGSVEGENWHGENRPKAQIFSTTNEGQFHLHGHIHSPNSGKSKKIEGRQMDVGVDANEFRPVSISQVERWISLTKKK